MARLRFTIIIALAISVVSLLVISIALISNPEPLQIALENEEGIVNESPEQNQTLPKFVQIPDPQAQEFIGRVLIIPESSHEIGARGWSGTLIVGLRPILGFEGETSLVVVNLPEGVTTQFTQPTVSLSQGSTQDVGLQIMIDKTAISGSYALTIEAHGDGAIWGAELVLEIVDHLIEMKGSTFIDGNLTISRGETVVWVNRDVPDRFDDLRHDVVSSDGVFRSPLLGIGESFRYTFDNQGTFRYSCEPHPWMVGQISVSE